MSPEQIESLKLFLPVGLAILTLVGGGLVYNWQKSADRKNQILQERRDLYRRFIGKAQLLQIHRLTKDETLAKKDYPEFKILLAELLVTAPDHVAETLRELDRSIAALLARTFSANKDGEFFGDTTDLPVLVSNAQNSFEKAVSEMRRDSFADTKLTDALLKEALRISTGVIGRPLG